MTANDYTTTPSAMRGAQVGATATGLATLLAAYVGGTAAKDLNKQTIYTAGAIVGIAATFMLFVPGWALLGAPLLGFGAAWFARLPVNGHGPWPRITLALGVTITAILGLYMIVRSCSKSASSNVSVTDAASGAATSATVEVV